MKLHNLPVDALSIVLGYLELGSAWYVVFTTCKDLEHIFCHYRVCNLITTVRNKRVFLKAVLHGQINNISPFALLDIDNIYYWPQLRITVKFLLKLQTSMDHHKCDICKRELVVVKLHTYLRSIWPHRSGNSVALKTKEKHLFQPQYMGHPQTPIIKLSCPYCQQGVYLRATYWAGQLRVG